MNRVRSLLGAILLVVSCGGGSTTTAPGTTPPDDASSLVGDVSMTWSGGITGDVTVVVVHNDGEVETTVNSEMTSLSQLSTTDLAALHDLVTNSEFADLAQTYVPREGICCDRFTYTVIAAVGSRNLESTTADGLENPPALSQVIQLLLDAAAGG